MIADLQRQLGIDASFFVQLGIFLLVFLWLRYIYFVPFLKLIQRRESLSEGRSDEARRLEEDSARMEQEYGETFAKIRKRASTERDADLALARKEAQRLAEEARGQAKAKLDSVREAAARSAEADLTSLRSQVHTVSSLLVEKLTKTKVGL